MQNPRWIYFNFNPWKKNIPDCSIRAISAATGLKYQEVCNMLKYSYKNGYGLIRQSGASLNHIKEVFSSYFDIVEDFYDNMSFVPDEFKGSEEAKRIQSFDDDNGIDSISGITLNDFIEMFQDKGVFLVSLEGNPKSRKPGCREGGHIVCAKCQKTLKQGFIDFWDSGDMLVDAYMRVKHFEPKDSPKHWRYDRETRRILP